MGNFFIVNADDYGASSEVNRAIEECLAAKTISSASMIMNMPGTDSACAHIRQNPDLDIGIHFNLTHGNPCTPMQCGFVRDGEFRGFFSLAYHVILALIFPFKRRALIAEIQREMAAQMNIFSAKTGRQPSHFNSHLTVQMLPFVFDCMAQTAMDHGVSTTRTLPDAFWRDWRRNIVKTVQILFKHKVLLKGLKALVRQSMLAMLMFACWHLFSYETKRRQYRLETPDHFFGITESLLYFDVATRVEILANIITNLHACTGKAELMVHPGLGRDLFNERSEDLLIEYQALMQPEWKQHLANSPFKLSGFDAAFSQDLVAKPLLQQK